WRWSFQGETSFAWSRCRARCAVSTREPTASHRPAELPARGRPVHPLRLRTIGSAALTTATAPWSRNSNRALQSSPAATHSCAPVKRSRAHRQTETHTARPRLDAYDREALLSLDQSEAGTAYRARSL